MKNIFAHALWLIVLLGCSSPKTEKETTAILAASEFQQKIKATLGALIIDIRNTEEVQNTGTIAQAQIMPYNTGEFEKQVLNISKTTPVFVYCQSGVRSKKALDFMNSQGFEKVYMLEGGFSAWKQANLPVQQ